MKTHLFRLECLTDLHVGNGEANYSIIDNEVQKDTVLADVPIIHASGVKGALKEHFEQLWKNEDGSRENDVADRILNIFGGIKKTKDKGIKEKNVTVEGSYKFFTAFCIARPLRVSSGSRPYILTAGMDALKSFSTFLEGLGLSQYYKYQEIPFDTVFAYSTQGNEELEIEGEAATKIENIGAIVTAPLQRLIGQEFAVAKTLRDYALPVRARNVLSENGISENLWYEELVPHKSIFYFAVITPGETCDLPFDVNGTPVPVQFGGNASIGNGYTMIKDMTKDAKVPEVRQNG